MISLLSFLGRRLLSVFFLLLSGVRHLSSGVLFIPPVSRPSSLFSELASGVWRPSSVFRLQAGVRRLASVVRLQDSGWRPASGVRRPSSGFSLVEVTLALMVMAIGILSIMSLFPAGLDQNARSIADTHAAFFAEEVFGGLQATAETNWVNLDQADLPIAAVTNWHPLSGLNTVFTSGLTNIYSPSSALNTNYVDHALRYRLVLTTNGLLKKATLFVWPGEFGTTNDPTIFYAEFFRWKQ